MKEIVIRTSSEYRRLCERLESCYRIGLDTEFIGEGRYEPALCLVQLATDDALYIVDPLDLPCLTDLWKLLTEPQRLVVVHAGRAELLMTHRYARRWPERWFDVQIAAGLVGLPYPASYGLLVEQLLGQQLGRPATMTDWSRRPLTADQLRYGFEDVRYLLPLHDCLVQKLGELQRIDWAEEEFGRFVRSLQQQQAEAAEGWRRFRGIQQLSRRQLAALRALYRWREEEAALRNRSPKSVCPDHALFELARSRPRSLEGVRRIRGVKPHYSEAILEQLKTVERLSEEELPETIEADPAGWSAVVSFLHSCLAVVAQRWQVAPSLLGNQTEMRVWLRRRLLGSNERPAAFEEGWRAKTALPVLEACLAGQLALRIRQPSDDQPLQLMEVPGA